MFLRRPSFFKSKGKHPLVLWEHWPFVLGMAIVSILLLTQYNQFWMAADDGYYAHTASRVLAGEIPHKDFHEFHSGLILWTNVLSLKIFGDNLASLRIPLVILGIIQAILIYKIIEPYGRIKAGMAMVMVGVMGLPSMQNPTANLYALFFAISTLYVARKQDLFQNTKSLVLLGVMVGLCVLFRHLSGVLLGCGLVIWMFSHPALQTTKGASILGRFLVALAFVGIMGYVMGRSDGFGLFVYALPALLIGITATFRARPDPTKTYTIIKWVGLGFIISLAPLLLNQLFLGTIGAWAHDIFILPFSLINMSFIDDWHYSLLLAQILFTAPYIENPLQIFNYIYWILLLLTPSIFSFWVFRQYFKTSYTPLKQTPMPTPIPAFVFCGPFYLIGILHFEIALYLLWGIPIILLSGFYFFSTPKNWGRKTQVLMTILTLGGFTALVGQPVWQGTIGGFVLGTPGQYNTFLLPEKGGIYLPEEEKEFYERMTALIKENATSNKQIFSFPSHPEWYYLTGLKNPTPHIFAGITLNSAQKLEKLKTQFLTNPPDIIIFKEDDKYNTPYTRNLILWLANYYTLIHQEHGFEILINKWR